MLEFFAGIGRSSIQFFGRLGRGNIFFASIIQGSGNLILQPRLLIGQLYSVGVLSMQIIAISGLTVGMVLGLQGYYNLSRFGSEEALGPFVALTLVREMGPVLAALLFSGRAGSALTAEIGLMKATEQLSSMAMMAVDPIKRVIVPRFVAGLISLPLLTAMFIIVGVYGGYFVGVGLLGVDSGTYWSQMQDSVDFYEDLVNGMVKSVVFGMVATWIAVFEGYDAVPTTSGVSRATMRTVVNTAFAVLGLNFILTALMFGDI